MGPHETSGWLPTPKRLLAQDDRLELLDWRTLRPLNPGQVGTALRRAIPRQGKSTHPPGTVSRRKKANLPQSPPVRFGNPRGGSCASRDPHWTVRTFWTVGGGEGAPGDGIIRVPR